MRHTQGEWYASEPKMSEVADGQTYFSIQSKNPVIRYDTYVMPGFYYPDSVQTLEEMQANAKLIAASPELLEALTDFLNMYEKLTENMVSRIGWDVAAKAKRAINKATL